MKYKASQHRRVEERITLMAIPVPVPSLWPTLLEQVEGHHGVMKVSIEFLRQIAGAQRMGPKVADKIEAGLEVQGLRAIPADLNRKQNEEVLLIQAGTPAYEVVSAVANGDVSDTLVGWLERLNTAPKDPAALVDRDELRQLVETMVDPVAQLLGLTRPYGEEEKIPEKPSPERKAHAQRLLELLPSSE